MSVPIQTSRNQTERVIAAARVVLAASGLFAVWLDPAEPVRYTAVTYGVHALYLAYSVCLLPLAWSGFMGVRLALLLHAVDIVLFSVFQYLTLGPSSPFFVYFIFSLFCGAMRWGWRGTLTTAAFVVVAYLGMGASMSRTLGPLEFEVNRFVIRTVYLAVTAGLLVYLGRFEERLRGEIERLARWPTPGPDMRRVTREALAHAADIIGAAQAVVVWERSEEPTTYLAAWSPAGSLVTKHASPDLHPLVAPALEKLTFVSVGNSSVAMVPGRTQVDMATAIELHPLLQPHLTGAGLTSAVVETGQLSGRVFFAGLNSPTLELVPLTEVVARELGASLEQLHLTRQLQEIAAGEERLRVARNLHDGVLQSLTGIRLEIRALAGTDALVDNIRDRLFAMERALALEQRELRLFIAELGPDAATRDNTPLVARLQSLRERIAAHWKAPVTIRVAEGSVALPEQIEAAVPLMVHEAVVNALKHGQPSRVAVTVDGSATALRIVVADDGHGFPFQGRYDHAALLENNAGPRSLFERVVELGGEMSIESSAAGARVEMVLSLVAAHG